MNCLHRNHRRETAAWASSLAWINSSSRHRVVVCQSLHIAAQVGEGNGAVFEVGYRLVEKRNAKAPPYSSKEASSSPESTTSWDGEVERRWPIATAKTTPHMGTEPEFSNARDEA